LTIDLDCRGYFSRNDQLFACVHDALVVKRSILQTEDAYSKRQGVNRPRSSYRMINAAGLMPPPSSLVNTTHGIPPTAMARLVHSATRPCGLFKPTSCFSQPEVVYVDYTGSCLLLPCASIRSKRERALNVYTNSNPYSHTSFAAGHSRTGSATADFQCLWPPFGRVHHAHQHISTSGYRRLGTLVNTLLERWRRNGRTSTGTC